jgi:cytidylate kinase
MPAAAIVITGAMAAGKSTVAQRLAERLPRAAHVRGDTFRRMIVSDRHDLEPDQTSEAVAQLRLRYRLAATVTDGYAQAGFTAVVQDVILGPDLATFVSLLTTRPRFVIVLAPHPDVLANREHTRDKKGYGAWTVESLDTALRQETPRLGLWLDTSNQTPDQTVQEIMNRLPEAQLPD